MELLTAVARGRFRTLSIAAISLSLIVACGVGGPAGKYVSETEPNDYLELKSDGTYTVMEGSTGFSGKYEIDGDQIILKTEIGFAQRGRVEGKTIIDPQGARWTRR